MLVIGCGVYSFTGVTFPPEVQSVYVAPVEVQDPTLPPIVGYQLGEAIRDQFMQFSRLQLAEREGDLNIYPTITGYHIEPVAPGQEQAYKSRVRLDVQVRYELRVPETQTWQRAFSKFVDVDAATDLASVEAQVLDELIQQLATDIYYGAGQDW